MTISPRSQEPKEASSEESAETSSMDKIPARQRAAAMTQGSPHFLSGGAASPALGTQAALCAWRTFGLLARRQLHLHHDRIGTTVVIPDGRKFVVFRESARDSDSGSSSVTLAVWFHLRGIPGGSRVRRFLFERLCLANTILFAGFTGYQSKLWMVDPVTSDYAGLYSWHSAEEAEPYARYIVRILAPLSQEGSVGYEILPTVSFADYLGSQEVPE